MIDVKTAVKNATEYIKELFPQLDDRGIQLEEVELTEDNKDWFITISYPDPDIFFPAYPKNRQYKIFKIDSVSGQIKSMKIRQLK